ncbi:hypothetical protein [Bradyrhizobium sp. 179]|uniref:hypothetical protein n=1 Tax=Bradyrhizobium sp. 179 TaxID=2782648 RepID=UPI001FF88353|nr:hypothetical protein [Bradyrhizobium sp. 179]
MPDVIGGRARRHLGRPKFKASEFELFLAPYTYFPQAEKLVLATSAWRKEIVDDAGLIDWMNNAYHSGGTTPVERIRAFFVRHHLPVLLEMVDDTTMAASVSLAFPSQTTESLRWRCACRSQNISVGNMPSPLFRRSALRLEYLAKRSTSPRPLCAVSTEIVCPQAWSGEKSLGFRCL